MNCTGKHSCQALCLSMLLLRLLNAPSRSGELHDLHRQRSRQSRHDSDHRHQNRAPTFSHLLHSLSQLLTRLVGQQMMMRLAMGSPPSRSWPLCSSVQIRVMPCSRDCWLELLKLTDHSH